MQDSSPKIPFTRCHRIAGSLHRLNNNKGLGDWKGSCYSSHFQSSFYEHQPCGISRRSGVGDGVREGSSLGCSGIEVMFMYIGRPIFSQDEKGQTSSPVEEDINCLMSPFLREHVEDKTLLSESKHFLLARMGYKYSDLIIWSLLKFTFLPENSRQMDYLLEIPGVGSWGAAGVDSSRNSSREGKGAALP